MQNTLSAAIVKQLWLQYQQRNQQINPILQALQQLGMTQYHLDHFAVIDLPGRCTGRAVLSQLFSLLGFVERGVGYLPEKVNDFTWLAERGADTLPATQVLPQVVVADFRLDELPPEVRNIIVYYADRAAAAPLAQLQTLLSQYAQDKQAAIPIQQLVLRYFAGRDWPLPTCREFYTVHEYNELLAWVLVFGRLPNHFTLSVHLLNLFTNFREFCDFIEYHLGFKLNAEGGRIKGGKEKGIAQSSTLGQLREIALADGNVQLSTDFIEFVWRYPLAQVAQPVLWRDYFTDFIAKHANHVIESLINS